MYSFKVGSGIGNTDKPLSASRQQERRSLDGPGGGIIQLSPMKKQDGELPEDDKPVVVVTAKMRKVHAFLNRKQEVIL